MCCSNTTRAEITVNCWGFSALRADHQAGAQRARPSQPPQPGLSICPPVNWFYTNAIDIFLWIGLVGICFWVAYFDIFSDWSFSNEIRNSTNFLGTIGYRNEQRVRDFHPSQGSYCSASFECLRRRQADILMGYSYSEARIPYSARYLPRHCSGY
jgi:hypothetical protein